MSIDNAAMTGKYGMIVEVMALGSRAVWGYSVARFFGGSSQKRHRLILETNMSWRNIFILSD